MTDILTIFNGTTNSSKDGPEAKLLQTTGDAMLDTAISFSEILQAMDVSSDPVEAVIARNNADIENVDTEGDLQNSETEADIEQSDEQVATKPSNSADSQEITIERSTDEVSATPEKVSVPLEIPDRLAGQQVVEISESPALSIRPDSTATDRNSQKQEAAVPADKVMEILVSRASPMETAIVSGFVSSVGYRTTSARNLDATTSIPTPTIRPTNTDPSLPVQDLEFVQPKGGSIQETAILRQKAVDAQEISVTDRIRTKPQSEASPVPQSKDGARPATANPELSNQRFDNSSPLQNSQTKHIELGQQQMQRAVRTIEDPAKTSGLVAANLVKPLVPQQSPVRDEVVELENGVESKISSRENPSTDMVRQPNPPTNLPMQSAASNNVATPLIQAGLEILVDNVPVEGEAGHIAGFSTTSTSDLRAVASTLSAAASQSGASAQAAQNIGRQLAVAISTNPSGTIEISLNPEELGNVRMQLQMNDGSINLMIGTERPEVLDLMRRNLDVLAQEFKELGFKDVGFSFDQDSQEGEENAGKNGNETSLNGVQSTDADEGPIQNEPGESNTDLDIRL